MHGDKKRSGQGLRGAGAAGSKSGLHYTGLHDMEIHKPNISPRATPHACSFLFIFCHIYTCTEYYACHVVFSHRRYGICFIICITSHKSHA